MLRPGGGSTQSSRPLDLQYTGGNPDDELMMIFNGLDLIRFSKSSGRGGNVIFRPPTSQNQSNFDDFIIVGLIHCMPQPQVFSQNYRLVATSTVKRANNNNICNILSLLMQFWK